MSADRMLPATPRRREQAHRRGLLHTSDGLAWIASTVVLLACLPVWLRSVAATFSELLGQLPNELADPHAPLGAFAPRFGWQLAWPTLMLLAATAATSLGIRLLLDRPKLVPGRLAAFDRLNPLHGLRRLASAETARQLAVSVVATTLLAVALRYACADLASHVHTATLDPRDNGQASLWLGWQGLWGLMGAAGLVAILQHTLRWRASERRLRMTAEELRDEQRLVEPNTRVRLPTRDAPEESGRSLTQRQAES